MSTVVREIIPIAARKERGGFYVMPLADLTSRVQLMASALRTLPDAQLAAELVELQARPDCASVPVAAMIGTYRAETSRRSSPEQRLDDELDEVLSRLERETTEWDRHRARQIGEELHRIDGPAAVARAVVRMTAGLDDRRTALRLHILRRRWAGLGVNE